MVKKLITWLWLMTKRLYKKPTFLVILALIPLLVVAYGSVAREESGMMTVALAREDEDPVAVAVMEELANEESLIRFVPCDSPDRAEAMVRAGKADSAWIFQADTENKIYKFVARPSAWNAFIRIIERESSIPLMLAREKLTGTVFSHCSRVLYLSYIRNHVRELDTMSDRQLMEWYDRISTDTELFQFAYLEGEADQDAIDSANYLLTPVRGLLSVVVMLCGLATAMYFVRDESLGTFAWVPENRKPFAEFGCQLVSLANVGTVMLLCLGALGLTVELGREILMLVLFMAGSALFSMTVRRLAGGMRALATVLPVLVVIMLVVCPVFFDLGALREFQYLFPPTYYVNAAHSNRFLVLNVLYLCGAAAAYFLAGKLPRRSG